MTSDDDVPEGFKLAHQKIESLLKRLSDRGVCMCCTARALAFHAATLAEVTDEPNSSSNTAIISSHSSTVIMINSIHSLLSRALINHKPQRRSLPGLHFGSYF